MTEQGMHEVRLPKKCKLCDVGTLKVGEDVALVAYNAASKELLMQSPQHVECVPCHTLVCEHCGNIILLSALKVPRI